MAGRSVCPDGVRSCGSPPVTDPAIRVERLADHTTLRLGGPSSSWVRASDEAGLLDAKTSRVVEPRYVTCLTIEATAGPTNTRAHPWSAART